MQAADGRCSGCSWAMFRLQMGDVQAAVQAGNVQGKCAGCKWAMCRLWAIDKGWLLGEGNVPDKILYVCFLARYLKFRIFRPLEFLSTSAFTTTLDRYGWPNSKSTLSKVNSLQMPKDDHCSLSMDKISNGNDNVLNLFTPCWAARISDRKSPDKEKRKYFSLFS